MAFLRVAFHQVACHLHLDLHLAIGNCIIKVDEAYSLADLEEGSLIGQGIIKELLLAIRKHYNLA